MRLACIKRRNVILQFNKNILEGIKMKLFFAVDEGRAPDVENWI